MQKCYTTHVMKKYLTNDKLTENKILFKIRIFLVKK